MGFLYAIWPCGTFCEFGEIQHYAHKSDDYMVVDVTEFSDDGTPVKYTVRAVRTTKPQGPTPTVLADSSSGMHIDGRAYRTLLQRLVAENMEPMFRDEN